MNAPAAESDSAQSTRPLSRPDITSMLALAVSVFALALGAWQTRLNRETTVAAIRVNDREVAAHFKSSIARFRMDICYCSVYDECWVAHWQQSRVDPVERCGADGSVQFDE